MSVISLINLKGGVAKTGSTINLATAMVKAGKHVFIIDSDSQGNIATARGIQLDSIEYSLANLIAKAIQDDVSELEIAGIFLTILQRCQSVANIHKASISSGNSCKI